MWGEQPPGNTHLNANSDIPEVAWAQPAQTLGVAACVSQVNAESSNLII